MSVVRSASLRAREPRRLSTSSGLGGTVGPKTIDPVKEAVSKISKGFAEIAQRDKEVQTKALIALKHHVQSASKKLQGDALFEFNQQLRGDICNNLISKNKLENLGAVAAIMELVKLKGISLNTDVNLTMFGRNLLNVLPPFGNDREVVVNACVALGEISFQITNPTMAQQFVSRHAEKALEWLENSTVRNDLKRHAATLILEALVKKRPNEFVQHIPSTFHALFKVIHDPKLVLRETGVGVLKECLMVWRGRSLYPGIYRDIEIGFQQSKEEIIHGSVMAANVFVTYTGDYIHETQYFESVCDSTILHFETRKEVVHSALIQLVPQLARVKRNVFLTYKVKNGSTSYFKIAMDFIIKSLRNQRYRSLAIAALGDLSLELKENMAAYLDMIVPELRAALVSKKAKTTTPQERDMIIAACSCIEKLVQALGTSFQKQAILLLDPLFESGLSDALVKTLQSIAVCAPVLEEVVQRRTLDVLSMILQGIPFQHPGLFANDNTATISSVKKKNSPPEGSNTPSRQPSLRKTDLVLQGFDGENSQVLALRTLRNFDFRLHSLTKFTKDCIAPLMFHDNPDVREAACLTAAAILVRPHLDNEQPKRLDVNKISAVVMQLLTAGISDRRSKIRCAVINSLGPSLEPYLAKVEALKMLFVCLYDDNLDTRKAAIRCVGRLSVRNPAYVMPALSKLLVKLLNDLTICVGTKTEYTSMLLLIELIRAASRVIEPYVDAVIEALRSKLKDVDSVVFPAALEGMGELAKVNEDCILEEVPMLMGVIIDVLTDQSSVSQKETAVKVLGQITRSTGYVIQPYADYPLLMPTLFNVLSEATNKTLKIECISVFGILGALDPYQEKLNRQRLDQNDLSSESSTTDEQPPSAINTRQRETAPLNAHHAVGSEEYFMDLVVNELMQIAYDPSLIHIHVHVIRSCGILVIKSGMKFIPYLPKMIPAFIHMIKSCESTDRHVLMNELAKIVEIFGLHLRAYIDDIIELIVTYWLPCSDGKYNAAPKKMHNVVIGLLKAMIHALGVEVKPHIARLLQHCMSIFTDGAAVDFDPICQVLEVFRPLTPLLGEWLSSAVMCTLSLIKDYIDTPLPVRQEAVQTIDVMANKVSFGLQSASVLNCLCRVMKYDEQMRAKVFNLLIVVIEGMGDTYVTVGHEKMVESLVGEVMGPEDQATYHAVVAKTRTKEGAAGKPNDPILSRALVNLPDLAPGGEQNKATQEYILKLAREATGIGKQFESNSDDWVNRLNRMLFMESHSTALAACQGLAEAHTPFARKLFKAAFASCWVVLNKEDQSVLVIGVERAMQHNKIFMQLMLNVIEFMSHYPTPPPPLFSDRALGQMGLDCSTYAKALRYKEVEFCNQFSVDELLVGEHPQSVKPSAELLSLVEDMIKINQALQEPEAAQGVMDFVQENMEGNSSDGQKDFIEPSWYEKLDEWDKALNAYELRLEENSMDFEMALGRMRCLDYLGKWQELHDLVEGAWPHATDEQKSAAARMACSAAAGLGVWEAIESYLTAIPREDPDYSLYGAMLAIYNDNYGQAEKLICATRELLEPTLISLWEESYSRGHTNMVKVQMLAELDEVVLYKTSLDVKSQMQLRRTWKKRLAGCQYNIDVWLPILKVRSLVLRPEDDLQMWLDYCSLCRKQGEATGSKALGLERSHANLITLLGCDPSEQSSLPLAHPRITYAYIKWMWVNNQPDEAIHFLLQLIEHVQNDKRSEDGQYDQLLARCYHKLGQWRAQPFLESAGEISSDITDEIINAILDSYHYATLYDRSWYKAWHAWAFMSYEAVSYYERVDNIQQRLSHAIMAITGFFNSIGLCEASNLSNLQDTLRLLTLWFKYGGYSNVAETIAAGVDSVAVDTWVQVIPQLIARIQVPDPKLRESIHDVLLQVGRCHPQAILFPLTVASHNYKMEHRQQAANVLLQKICEHSAELVEQARMVSKELIRVAILWTEMWFEGLDEASRHYSEKNYEAMFAVLAPLHNTLKVGEAATTSEAEFIAAYGTDLNGAWDRCLKYRSLSNRRDLEAAWDHYHRVYRMISKSLPMLTSLELQDVSPKLFDARDLQLVIPGTYLKSREAVNIHSFNTRMTVINSKRRVRRFGLTGTDGKNYQYLLKAHEDLRQDERVMQLFSLINSLLGSHATTAKQHLEIRSYFVMPLSVNLGIMEWVPTCDTVHGLVRMHRERNGIVLNQEVRLMLAMTPDYDLLTTIQKIEVFRTALAAIEGDDIARVMWLQSKNAESWLERRTTYTRTLAIMSMVGYILGLGDRHPSNLMMDRISGSIMHVDFGDCFEVAMKRPKYPEKVPFRLTRMLIKAMEVCGIEGTYRKTCEKVMHVMRSNADSLIAVLEAFVHDPLIDWFRQNQPDNLAQPTGYALENRNEEDSMESSTSSDSRVPQYVPDAINSRAIDVLGRVKDKLNGKDFMKDEKLDVKSQVSRLIKDATAHENLCQHYTGWCSFW